MLIALWLAITWLLYGSGRDYEPDNVGIKGLKSSCPYVCAVGDSIMMNIFESDLPINSAGDLHARCGVTKFLINDCWNEDKYGSDCLPQRADLREKTINFSKANCTERFYENTDQPCFWRWSHQENRCSDEYQTLVGHLLGKGKIEINHNRNTICCDFLKFQECAKEATTSSCSAEVEDFVQRFFFKLAGQKALNRCVILKKKPHFKKICNLSPTY